MNSKDKMQPNKFLTNGKSKVVNGSIINPEMGNLRLIFVPCSASGKPDSDLHAVLNKKWKTVAAELKGWYSNNIDFKMGSINRTSVQSDTWVLHALCMDAQGKLDEKALAACVKKVADMAKYEKASVHVSHLTAKAMPKLIDMLHTSCVEKGTHVLYYDETTPTPVSE